MNKREGKIWIDGMQNVLAGETLAATDIRERLGDRHSVDVLPDVWVLKIGGQSIMDRGGEAVHPILEELRTAQKNGTKFVIGAGGGTRARHVYALGLDLEMPTGMLARLGSSVPVQNARMLQMLMAKDGGIMMYPDDFEKLPFFLNAGCIPIMSGMPPNEFWEKSASVGLLPTNRTDAGVYLMAEFLGAKGVLFIKDEDGLYTDDPKKNPDAKLIPEANAAELLASGQDDLIVERVVLEYMTRAEKVKEIRIINGLKPGQVTAALNGEQVGSVIRA
ncbi:MAG: uridine kinase [Gammaproteobacteria bacterium]|nr:uridine kinase [Gammaproteobacteria bacterium]NNF61885.1 uridine kinase [Gammaproteobacteria bacterium]NNM19647.1 uridine kinase [Gammaproteobacteria bacterium]